MNRSCFVPGCSSGYHTCLEKVSLFGAPKDEHRRSKWNLMIPRLDKVISIKDVVCEKHFRSEDIIRVWKSGDIEVKLKKPKLIDTAIPSIFPDKIKSAPKPTKNPKHPQKPGAHYEKERPHNLFKSIWKQLTHVPMPGPEWGVHSLIDDDSNQTILIAECELSDDGVPYYRKQLHVSASLKLRFYVGDTQIAASHLSELGNFMFRIKTRTELRKCLVSWHSIKVCDGGPTTNIYGLEKIQTNIATVTPKGLWRHINCKLVYYDQNQCCTECLRLYHLFKEQFSIRVYHPIHKRKNIDHLKVS